MSIVVSKVAVTNVVDTNVDASEYCALFLPTTSIALGSASPRYGKYGAILLPGYGTPDMWNTRGPWPHANLLAFKIAQAGIPCMAIADTATVTQDGWCNNASMAAIQTAMAYFSTYVPGMPNSKAQLIGLSMGGGAGNRFTALYPQFVASWTGIISLASMFPIYAQNNPAGTQLGINTAWALTNRTVNDGVTTNNSSQVTSATAAFIAGDVGAPITGANIPVGSVIGTVVNGTTVNIVQCLTGSPPFTNPATATATGSGISLTIYKPLPYGGGAVTTNADILSMATAIKAAGIPAWEYYDTDDPYITQADFVTLAANSGAQTYSLGATGHTDAALAALPMDAIVANLIASGS